MYVYVYVFVGFCGNCPRACSDVYACCRDGGYGGVVEGLGVGILNKIGKKSF